MTSAELSFAAAAALVSGLTRFDVRHACITPGSRSTPLALALARDEGIAVQVHLDERSAAFSAVGLAKMTGDPVIVACTSGTAAAELFPAVVEAWQSRTPLILLTADRPPALRGTGANQTIDQVELFGRFVRAYLELPMPETRRDAAEWLTTGFKAASTASRPSPGPVHVNCPFGEPLTPDPSGTEAPISLLDGVGNGADGGPSVWVEGAADAPDTRDAVRSFVQRYGGRRGVITIGSVTQPRTLSLLSLGTLLGWPVLAEPLSGLRLDASDAGRGLAAGQFLIGDERWLDAQRPEVVLQVGAAPTTRATQALVANVETLVVLDTVHLDPDPGRRATHRIVEDPEGFAAIAWDERNELGFPDPDPQWLETWRAADLIARAAIDRHLDLWAEPFEGRVARDVASFLPHGATLVVGSSLPVRDLDLFMAPRRPPRIWNPSDLLRVIGNRGASGIDGLVSTTLGAAAGTSGPTVALLGDLSFLYDAGALLWSSRLGVDAVFVVLANGGGQIFSMLDQAALPEFDELFLTPHPASIASVCAAAAAGHSLVQRAGDLTGALERAIRAGGVQVVEVEIDAERDRARRAELRDRVREVLVSR
jgi:2-succinyl-5-enolpyruvyl-6-hydroxy-3-cyclohexene-1-carboxylate synthase